MLNSTDSPTTLEPEDYTEADRELAQQGVPGSLLYAAIWLAIMLFTPVGHAWPVLSWAAFGGLLIVGVFRLLMGVLFNRLHGPDPGRWRMTYTGLVLVQAAIWSGLNAFLILQYVTEWPAMLISFVSAGLAAGGTLSTTTHRTLQSTYIPVMLLPSALACWTTGDAGAIFMGVLFVADIGFLIIVGHRLGRGYWTGLGNTRLLKRRAEELDEARRKAETADKAKSRFVARVSHELRTPLNGLIGTLDMMRRDSASTAHGRHVQIMSMSADLLLRQINELLDFSKLEVGKLELQPVAMDPASVVTNAVMLERDAASAKHLALTTRLPDAPVSPVVGDPSRITQILLNLISNAIKFTPTGGIEVTLEQETAESGGTRCRFSVSDSGIGIAPDAQDRIFDSFEQANGSTSREYGGTGLGLSVSRDLARLMRGDISVVSREGEGACFTLVLDMPPAASAGQATDPAISTGVAPPGQTGLNLLVADDNEINRIIVEDMLATLGCSCELVKDGAACIERFAAAGFDAILMDCEMPGTDGFTASRRIREIEALDNRVPVPIIALTAHADEDSRRESEQAGMSDFMTKPFTLDDLDAALRRATRALPGEARTVAAASALR